MNKTQMRYYRHASGFGITKEEARKVVNKLLQLSSDEERRKAVGLMAGAIRDKKKRESK